jgi:hypothetical protein
MFREQQCLFELQSLLIFHYDVIVSRCQRQEIFVAGGQHQPTVIKKERKREREFVLQNSDCRVWTETA